MATTALLLAACSGQSSDVRYGSSAITEQVQPSTTVGREIPEDTPPADTQSELDQCSPVSFPTQQKLFAVPGEPRTVEVLTHLDDYTITDGVRSVELMRSYSQLFHIEVVDIANDEVTYEWRHLIGAQVANHRGLLTTEVGKRVAPDTVVALRYTIDEQGLISESTNAAEIAAQYQAVMDDLSNGEGPAAVGAEGQQLAAVVGIGPADPERGAMLLLQQVALYHSGLGQDFMREGEQTINQPASVFGLAVEDTVPTVNVVETLGDCLVVIRGTADVGSMASLQDNLDFFHGGGFDEDAVRETATATYDYAFDGESGLTLAAAYRLEIGDGERRIVSQVTIRDQAL